MAAATADRTGLSEPVQGIVTEQRKLPVAASAVIFAYTMVSADVNGYAVPAADVAAQNGKGIAVSQECADNSAGADGDIFVLCQTRGVAIMETGALTQAALLTTAHAADDQTLATSSANGREIGRVVGWSATRTSVQIG